MFRSRRLRRALRATGRSGSGTRLPSFQQVAPEWLPRYGSESTRKAHWRQVRGYQHPMRRGLSRNSGATSRTRDSASRNDRAPWCFSSVLAALDARLANSLQSKPVIQFRNRARRRWTGSKAWKRIRVGLIAAHRAETRIWQRCVILSTSFGSRSRVSLRRHDQQTHRDRPRRLRVGRNRPAPRVAPRRWLQRRRHPYAVRRTR